MIERAKAALAALWKRIKAMGGPGPWTPGK